LFDGFFSGFPFNSPGGREKNKLKMAGEAIVELSTLRLPSFSRQTLSTSLNVPSGCGVGDIFEIVRLRCSAGYFEMKRIAELHHDFCAFACQLGRLLRHVFAYRSSGGKFCSEASCGTSPWLLRFRMPVRASSAPRVSSNNYIV
jgi:hypothetical protein